MNSKEIKKKYNKTAFRFNFYFLPLLFVNTMEIREYCMNEQIWNGLLVLKRSLVGKKKKNIYGMTIVKS
jgi:hypothetical protein